MLHAVNGSVPMLGKAGGKRIIDQGFGALREALEMSQRQLHPALLLAAEVIGACFTKGGKVLVCGNGGSAAEAQHLAAELVGRFKLAGRPALPALALSADTAVLTAWSNDAAFEDVFARGVEAFGGPGDVLVGLSTSGRSTNVVQAFRTAHRRGLHCVALLGGDGGNLRELADIVLMVPSSDTQRVQEVHSLLVHLLCELVEMQLIQHWSAAASAVHQRDVGQACAETGR